MKKGIRKMRFYVSTYSKNKEIYICNINNVGKLSLISSKKLENFPSYLSRYKNRIAIALKTNELNELAGILLVDQQFNEMQKYRMKESYTHIYNEIKFIIAASYHQGCILVINKCNGKIIKRRIYNDSKIHNVGKVLKNVYYAVDLHNSKIYFFKIINNELKKLFTLNLDKSIKPRHLLCKSYGRNIYIVSENTSEILVYTLTNGMYKKIQIISTISNLNEVGNTASAIRCFKKHLFVSNRGDNSIVMYKIKSDGRLELENYFDIYGKCPRDFNILGHYVVVANEESNEIRSFKINYRKNTMQQVDSLYIERPVCIEK